MTRSFWRPVSGFSLAAMALFSLPVAQVMAQTPIAPTPAPAPPSPILPPAGTAPAKTLTLDQVLTLALRSNSSVQLARERVIKAQQLIAQANAAGLPQVRVDLVDTYSSIKTFNTASGGGNTTGTLPGGGVIPVITDEGGGSTSSFTGGGGGGTGTSSDGTSSSLGTTPQGTGTLSGGGTTGTQGNTGTVGSTGTTGTGTPGTTGTTGTGGTPGSTGTSGSTFGTTGPTAQFRMAQAVADLPPLIDQLALATESAPAASTGAAAGPVASPARQPRVDTTGTGTVPGNGTLENGFRGGSSNNYSARFTVTQGIDLFKLVPAAQDVETLTRDFYVTDLDRVANETVLSVKNTYFNVLRDQAQVRVNEQLVAADTESVRIAQVRFDAGATARYDVLTAQTTLSNAQTQLSSSRNTLTLAAANLNNLVGLDQDTTVTLEEPAQPPLTQRFDRTALTRTALANRPEVKQADRNITLAERLKKLAGVGLLPSLSIVGSGGYTGPITTNSHTSYTISAVIGIPLYDGGATKAKVRTAESDVRTQKITRDQLRLNVDLEVRQALSNINDAQTRAASTGIGASTADEAYRLANVRYQNGIGTILDVVNAQAQLAQAQSNLLNAQYDYQTSLAQLTRAIGGR